MFNLTMIPTSNWSFEFNLKMMNTMVCSSRGSSFNEFRKQREDAAVVANGFNPTGLNSMVQQYGSTVWFNPTGLNSMVQQYGSILWFKPTGLNRGKTDYNQICGRQSCWWCLLMSFYASFTQGCWAL